MEYIARQADTDLPGSNEAAPTVQSISEVGIGVPDVGAACATLTDTLEQPRFPPQEPHFAPVGNHDGLLIIVDQDRVWFPTRTHHPARGPVDVRIAAPDHPRSVELTDHATIAAT